MGSFFYLFSTNLCSKPLNTHIVRVDNIVRGGKHFDSNSFVCVWPIEIFVSVTSGVI